MPAVRAALRPSWARCAGPGPVAPPPPVPQSQVRGPAPYTHRIATPTQLASSTPSCLLLPSYVRIRMARHVRVGKDGPSDRAATMAADDSQVQLHRLDGWLLAYLAGRYI